jgi:putative transcriptional regulator
MSDDMFKALQDSIHEAGAILKGERKASKVTVLEPSDVTKVRHDLGLSRSEFSKVLGVSERTIEGWEQKRRKPRGAAEVLLKVAKQHPEILLELSSSE